MRTVFGASFFVVAFAAIANATPAIDVGTYTLLPNTSGQTITLTVSGGDAVTGFNLRAQINDGTGPQSEPIFQAVSFNGTTIWDSHPSTTTGGTLPTAPSDAQGSVVLNNIGDSVSASGNLVTLTISTAGISSGSFPLLLKNTQIGVDSAFIGPQGAVIPANITNGTLNVAAAPEPSVSALFFVVVAVGLLRRRQTIGCAR